jgi:hypothetical protein
LDWSAAVPYPEILLTTPTPTFDITTRPATIPGIRFTYLGWPGSHIENAWIRITSLSLNVNGATPADDIQVSVDGGTAITHDANGYYYMSLLPNLWVILSIF